MGLLSLFSYLGFLGGILMAIFRRPVYGLFVLVPLFPLQTLRYNLHQFPLGAQFIDALLAAVCIGLLVRGRPLFPSTPFSRIFAIYVGYAYVSLWLGAFHMGLDLPFFFNDSRLAGWKNYIVLYLLFFLVVSAVETKRDLKILLLLMVGSILLIDKNFYSGVSGRDMSTFSDELRFGGVMGFVGANGVGGLQAQVFGAFLTMWVTAANFRTRLIYLGLTAASLYCVLFAFSRGAYVAVLFAWLFVGVMKSRILLVAFVLFLVSWEVFVPPVVRQRVTMTVGEDGQLESSSADRVGMWDDALQVFREEPILGTGFYTYAFMGRRYLNAHNLFIQTLVEAGIVGLIILLVMISKMTLYGIRMYRTLEDPLYRNLGLALAAYVVALFGVNMFGVRIVYVEISGFTFAFLGLLVRAQQLSELPEPVDAADEPLAEDTDQFSSVTGPDLRIGERAD